METNPSLCAECGESLPNVGEFCPACGSAVKEPELAMGKTGGLPDRVAVALAYVLVLPAIFFLLRSPFSKNRFIRFHAWQSVLVAAATVILFSVLLMGIGWVLVIGVTLILAVGWVILWIVLVVKALQGVMFELPGLGAVARRQAGGA